MPPTLTYPGVYIVEKPSGVRTIMGVATSVTAFIGGARKGPTARAVSINNVTDYERYFGQPHTDSYLGYAVSHFFGNGGSEARVVRVTHPDAKPAEGAGGGLTVRASSAGTWGNTVQVVITALQADATKFSLRVEDVSEQQANPTRPAVVLETYNGLSMNADDPRYVRNVVDEASLFLQWVSNDQQASTTMFALSGGEDGPAPVLKTDDPEFLNAVNPDRPGGRPPALDALDRLDIFNLLCVAGMTDEGTLSRLQKFCEDKRAFLIADCRQEADLQSFPNGPPDTLVSSASVKNAAFYFPWVKAADPLKKNALRPFPPSGFIAGVYARTDATRGVWKAPAGTEAALNGSAGLTFVMTDLENGRLNPKAVNCLRQFPVYGRVVWGARTLDGADERASDHKYIPVRRLTLYIEESLYKGTKWAVFEPNDEPLWAQLRLNIGSFMHDLFRQGAFQGRSPREAYFVKCDKETTTQSDINRGIVNVLVGFAPLKPAEFVVITIQQMAGQLET
jgi:phage tail sheath protein FI